MLKSYFTKPQKSCFLHQSSSHSNPIRFSNLNAIQKPSPMMNVPTKHPIAVKVISELFHYKYSI